MMRRALLVAAVAAAVACLAPVAASIPATSASGPVLLPTLGVPPSPMTPLVTPNLPVMNGAPSSAAAAAAVAKADSEANGKAVTAPTPVEPKYLPGTDFIGAFSGVPVNPTAHLQRSLAEDARYVASILRAPVDLGDPTDCKHSDIEKDERELRKIALRINHRRVSLRQQQSWLEEAREGLRKIETAIASTTSSAENLAQQMDALQAQREDITNHVRRAVLLKELDRTSSNLMRLKNARMHEEVRLQKKHNKFAVKNHEHNKVLEKLHKMRSNGLALGKLKDPKPYRFAQEGVDDEAANDADADADADADTSAEDKTQASAESESATETDGSTETEASAETEQSVETEQATDSESEATAQDASAAEIDSSAETMSEGDAETEVQTETESKSDSHAEATQETETETATEIAAEANDQSETEAETTTESTTEVDTATENEAESGAESEAESTEQ